MGSLPDVLSAPALLLAPPALHRCSWRARNTLIACPAASCASRSGSDTFNRLRGIGLPHLQTEALQDGHSDRRVPSARRAPAAPDILPPAREPSTTKKNATLTHQKFAARCQLVQPPRVLLQASTFMQTCAVPRASRTCCMSTWHALQRKASGSVCQWVTGFAPKVFF